MGMNKHCLKRVLPFGTISLCKTEKPQQKDKAFLTLPPLFFSTYPRPVCYTIRWARDMPPPPKKKPIYNTHIHNTQTKDLGGNKKPFTWFVLLNIRSGWINWERERGTMCFWPFIGLKLHNSVLGIIKLKGCILKVFRFITFLK